MTIRCIVSDIDGTIAHREPYGSFDVFEATAPKLKPVVPMRSVLQGLANSGLYILYATARRIEISAQTREWLRKNNFPSGRVFFREAHDAGKTPKVLKPEQFGRIIAAGFTPLAWFEDDEGAIDALRAAFCPVVPVTPH